MIWAGMLRVVDSNAAKVSRNASDITSSARLDDRNATRE